MMKSNYADADDIQNIAPAVSRHTALMLALSINSKIQADDPETEHAHAMSFIAMRAVLECEGIITPQQSMELHEYMRNTCASAWSELLNGKEDDEDGID